MRSLQFFALTLLLLAISSVSVFNAVEDRADEISWRRTQPAVGNENRSFVASKQISIQGQEVHTYRFASEGPNVTPPPGLDLWPLPGEIYFSEAFLENEAISAEFQETSGVINQSALAFPGELLAYIGVDIDYVNEEFQEVDYSAEDNFGGFDRPFFEISGGFNYLQGLLPPLLGVAALILIGAISCVEEVNKRNSIRFLRMSLYAFVALLLVAWVSGNILGYGTLFLESSLHPSSLLAMLVSLALSYISLRVRKIDSKDSTTFNAHDSKYPMGIHLLAVLLVTSLFGHDRGSSILISGISALSLVIALFVIHKTSKRRMANYAQTETPVDLNPAPCKQRRSTGGNFFVSCVLLLLLPTLAYSMTPELYVQAKQAQEATSGRTILAPPELSFSELKSSLSGTEYSLLGLDTDVNRSGEVYGTCMVIKTIVGKCISGDSLRFADFSLHFSSEPTYVEIGSLNDVPEGLTYLIVNTSNGQVDFEQLARYFRADTGKLVYLTLPLNEWVMPFSLVLEVMPYCFGLLGVLVGLLWWVIVRYMEPVWLVQWSASRTKSGFSGGIYLKALLLTAIVLAPYIFLMLRYIDFISVTVLMFSLFTTFAILANIYSRLPTRIRKVI